MLASQPPGTMKIEALLETVPIGSLWLRLVALSHLGKPSLGSLSGVKAEGTQIASGRAVLGEILDMRRGDATGASKSVGRAGSAEWYLSPLPLRLSILTTTFFPGDRELSAAGTWPPRLRSSCSPAQVDQLYPSTKTTSPMWQDGLPLAIISQDNHMSHTKWSVSPYPP